jgi:hypothetical protein
VLPVDEHLWHEDVIATHAFPYLVLVFVAHEDVSFFELDEEGTQDLLHLHARLVRLPEDPHCRRVHHHLAGVLLLVVLQQRGNYIDCETRGDNAAMMEMGLIFGQLPRAFAKRPPL